LFAWRKEVDPASKPVDAIRAEIKTRYDWTVHEAVGPLPPLRMIVDIEPLDFSQGRYEVRTWLKRGDSDPGASDTPVRNQLDIHGIAELIDHTIGNQIGPWEVELFLPLEMLAEGVGHWRVPFGPVATCPIDARYPVKLRARDRLYGDSSGFTPAMTDAWRARFEALPGRGQHLGDQHILGLCRAEDYAALDAAPVSVGSVCVAASLAPPEQEADSSTARATLNSLLRAGTPIAIWPAPAALARYSDQCDIYDECGIYSQLKAIVTARPLEKLPDLVCAFRQNSDWDTDPIKHLCLLWDDPGRLPPGLDEPLVSLGYT
jgi:hypothetical protein